MSGSVISLHGTRNQPSFKTRNTSVICGPMWKQNVEANVRIKAADVARCSQDGLVRIFDLQWRYVASPFCPYLCNESQMSLIALKEKPKVKIKSRKEDTYIGAICSAERWQSPNACRLPSPLPPGRKTQEKTPITVLVYKHSRFKRMGNKAKT